MCLSFKLDKNVLLQNKPGRFKHRDKVGMRMSLTTKEINLNLDDIWNDSSLILKAYDLCSQDIH